MNRLQPEHDSATVKTARVPRIFVLTANGDAYSGCLNDALRQHGAEPIVAPWSGKWLLHSARNGDAVMLHWPSFLYYDPKSRLRTATGLLRLSVVLGLLKLRGVRIIWVAHNLYPHEGGRALLAHRLGRLIVTRLAWRIGVHGKAAGEIVSQQLSVPRHKLVYLQHGHWIGLHKDTISRGDARRLLGVNESTYLYLFIGMCRPYKNLEALVDAFARIDGDAALWIVGRFHSPEYLAQVRAAAAKHQSACVTVRDEFVADDDLQTYLNASDCVVLPYRDVLTSGAAMLALSYGRPVVAPRLGALPEVVSTECGVLYDADAPTGLATAMAAARARSYNTTEILNTARRFSWDQSAQALLSTMHAAHI